jgi:hypothetical protein
MTNETTAPERIWANLNCSPIGSVLQGTLDLEPSLAVAQVEYVPATALEAAQARIAELESHLSESLAVIADYLEYEHDGDPWSEDARLMGEMEINEYERSGRLKEARAALEGKG